MGGRSQLVTQQVPFVPDCFTLVMSAANGSGNAQQPQEAFCKTRQVGRSSSCTLLSMLASPFVSSTAMWNEALCIIADGRSLIWACSAVKLEHRQNCSIALAVAQWPQGKGCCK